MATSRTDAPSKGIDLPTSGSTTTEDLPRPSEEGQSHGHLGSSRDHIFSDPATADYWRLKYEKAGYENRHRFDPEAEWSAEEERKLVRKVRTLKMILKKRSVVIWVRFVKLTVA